MSAIVRSLGMAFSLLILAGCLQPIQPSVHPGPAGANRLLVLGADGNLFTVAPDGSGRLDLTDDATPQRYYTQPTWSPTGERIAWAEVSSAPGEMSGALITAAADGSNRTRANVTFPPFYLHWSPDGAQVAYLSNWLGSGAQTIALRLVDLRTGGADTKMLGIGQPFYFAWAPDSSQVLTHVANRRLGLLGLDGAETVLSDRTARFAAPQWSSDGQHLLYAIHDEPIPQLVMTDPAGLVEQVITLVAGDVRIAFSLSPNGGRVAYTETDAPVTVNSLGPLFVFDLATEEYEQLSSEPVIAFFWSPTGDKLLYMTIDVVGERPWLQLHVWDGEQKQALSRFIPSGLFFNQYLPFADQYAQNMRFWSPDGRAVVFAGEDEQGRRGVWVRALDAAAPTFVAEGIVASWSPR